LGFAIDEEVFGHGPNLKVVASPTTGLDHIDLRAADQHKVQVISLQGDHDFLDSVTATAELTWALLLALVRNLTSAVEHVRGGGWNRDLFVGGELTNKTIGIVGHGRLGAIVAQYARAFRMRVVTCDPNPRGPPDFVELVSLDDLLSQSDYVSIHVPLEQKTRSLIDAHALEKVKRGAYVINTSRGGVVDENAILNAIKSKKLNGYAADVLVGEFSKSSNWLQNNVIWQAASSHDNIILTPHVGGATLESMQKTEVHLARKIQRYVHSEYSLL